MDFKFTPEEIAFQKEVDEFMQREVTPELTKEIRSGKGYGPLTWEFIGKLAAKGYLVPHWPKEYGGEEAPYMRRFIIIERLIYHGLSLLQSVGVGMAGPVILMYGTDEQKKEFLPRIARGEIEFALGYTEPEAGSDLASLEMRAVKDGDDYIVNGQKMFNTRTHFSQYHWLLARTDLNLPKHRGLSLFIVDLKSPGITVRPMQGMRIRTNEVFYDNVRVPVKNLVGKENQGWYQVNMALQYERVAYGIVAEQQRLLKELVKYCRETQRDGKPLSQDPLVRQKLAQLAIEIEVGRLLAYKVAWMLSKGQVPDYESGLTKLFNSELKQKLAHTGTQILGLYASLDESSPWTQMDGTMEWLYQLYVFETVGAGASEIMRNVIAIRGLGLPRS